MYNEGERVITAKLRCHPCYSNEGDLEGLKHPPRLTQSYASHCRHLPSFSQKADLHVYRECVSERALTGILSRRVQG